MTSFYICRLMNVQNKKNLTQYVSPDKTGNFLVDK